MTQPKAEPKHTREAVSNERVKLPSPAELAQIAASLGPAAYFDKPIEEAMKLYLQAVLFLDEVKDASLDAIAERIGYTELFEERMKSDITKGPLKPLHLDLKGKRDEVRDHLRERGVTLKNARSVLDMVKKYESRRSAKKWLKAKGLTIERRADLTETANDTLVIREAEKHGWKNAVREVRQGDLVQIFDGEQTFPLTEHLLDLVVAWKKGRKRSGGQKSRVKKNLKEAP